MKKEDEFHDIVIFDEQEIQEYNPTPNKDEKKHQRSQSHHNNEIFVFDDENYDETQYDQEIIYSKNTKLRLKNTDSKSMSAKQYQQKCTELSDRIIFSNLTNFQKQAQNNKKLGQNNTKHRESKIQATMAFKQNLDIINVPWPKNKIQQINCNFSQIKINNPKPLVMNEIETIMQSSLNDQLTTEASKKKKTVQKNQNTPSIQGANFEKKSITIQQMKEKNILKVSNFRQFLFIQLNPAYQIYVKIKKVEDGFFKTKYKFYFQQNNKFIMSCQKSMFTKYIFSTSEIHTQQNHISYLGKMQCNFLGSQFMIYDGGDDYNETKIMQKYKKQLGFIQYAQEKGKPRQLQTFITTCDNKQSKFTVHDKLTENVIMDRWGRKKCQKITRLYSKEPNFDAQECNYKLDFRGLAGIPSTKNFIIQNEDYPDALIFGRQDKESYLLRIKSPFSLMQAFAICISSIHYKFL